MDCTPPREAAMVALIALGLVMLIWMLTSDGPGEHQS